MSEQENKGNNLLDQITFKQIQILQLNQQRKANGAYLIHKETEINKLKSRIYGDEKIIDTLNKNYEKYSTTGALEASRTSVEICNKALELSWEFKLLQGKEKEKQEKELKSIKKEFEKIIKNYTDNYEDMKKEYETNTPRYLESKGFAEHVEELEKTVSYLKNQIMEIDNKIKQKHETQKNRFYSDIFKFSKCVLIYQKNEENDKILSNLLDEEMKLMKRYSEIEIKVKQKKSSMVSTSTKQPFKFVMPQFNKLLASPISSRPKLPTVLSRKRTYSISSNVPLKTFNENNLMKQSIDLMKIHDSSKSQYFKNLNLRNSLFTPSATYSNINQKNKNNDSIKTGKINVIDVKVIPPSSAGKMKQNPNEISSKDNTLEKRRSSNMPNIITSSQKNKENACFKRSNSLKLSQNREGKTTRDTDRNISGLTQELHDQLNFPPVEKFQNNNNFTKISLEKSITQNSNEIETSGGFKTANSSFHEELNLSFSQGNIMNSSVFGNVSGIDLDNNLSGQYCVSPFENASAFEEQGTATSQNQENKTPPTGSFSVFKFGQRGNNNNSDGKNKLFNMYF